MLRPAAARTRGAAALVCATRSERGRGLEPRSLLHGLFTAEHACHHRRAEDRGACWDRTWRHLPDSTHPKSAGPLRGQKRCASGALAHGTSLPVIFLGLGSHLTPVRCGVSGLCWRPETRGRRHLTHLSLLVWVLSRELSKRVFYSLGVHSITLGQCRVYVGTVFFGSQYI